ncbi:MAG: N-6 DNA methylase, partial [Thermodesulfobacteriota bacterium]|nr:N-6 DNA methylase [Thermodesulfobacteriota bacterium]
MTKEEARQEIAKLVARYQSLDERSIRTYSEADTRRTFIEPLFGALGWDVYSREEVAEEVKAAGGLADYVFKLHGVSQFYLEAKALRAELTKPEYVKQAITYAYNKGITWAVLTDFEGLQVYNAQTSRSFINLSCDNYLRDFDDLWLLSRESFLSNALNEKAEKYGALPPRLGVEQRLYNQLRQWREGLSSQLYHYNQNLSFSQIDEVIQRLFNRLIFIRTCEDRGIENKALLSAVHEWKRIGGKGELIETLRSIFRYFDGYYDSDLFQHHLTDEVFIESATIEGILNGLYEIPGGIASYDFSLIDADVLGAVYEQYLGHVATVVKQRASEAQARMDLGLPQEPIIEITAKKQRRKEHGIYYTPKFVTSYIVKETIGRFLQERNYNKILNMKILDPACGSGSFLIRAYDELLNYHAYQRGKPVSELDQWERLQILTSNIFGVDLDMQAVEIARLNLLLRSLAKRDSLPSLTDNIRQGNSLISGTEEELEGYFGDNWREKKPFDWEQEFKDIMAQGGFDVVIGNPPWVSLKGKFGVEDFTEAEINYLTEEYKADTYRPNMVEYFIKRSLMLLKEGGFHSFVIPDRVFSNLQFEDLRKQILETCRVHSLIYRVPFPGTIADAAIYIVQKGKPSENWEIAVHQWEEPSVIVPQAFYRKSADHSFAPRVDRRLAIIMDKVEKSRTVPLGEISGSNVGFIAKSGKVTKISTSQDDIAVYKGENVLRYAVEGHFYFNFIKTNLAGGTQAVTKLGIKEKILLRKTGDRILATLDKSGNFPEQSLYFLYILEDKGCELRYILALLNSCLLNCYYISRLVTNIDTMPQLKKVHLDRFPIRHIDFDNPNDKKMHDDLVTLVDKMLELNKRLVPVRNTPCNERDELIREIKRADKEIDNIVYD